MGLCHLYATSDTRGVASLWTAKAAMSPRSPCSEVVVQNACEVSRELMIHALMTISCRCSPTTSRCSGDEYIFARLFQSGKPKQEGGPFEKRLDVAKTRRRESCCTALCRALASERRSHAPRRSAVKIRQPTGHALAVSTSTRGTVPQSGRTELSHRL